MSIWNMMFGISPRKVSSLSHGDSLRNLYAVSKVAPPHISMENRSLPYLATAGAILSMSTVRTRVAISDC